MTKRKIDIAVIVPLEEELEQFQEVFPQIEEVSSTPYVELVDSSNDDLSMLVMLQEAMGKTSAAAAADFINSNFEVTLIVSLGIAGGLSKDLMLGDVCYSTRIIDVLDNSKVSDDSGELSLALAPEQFQTPQRVSASIDLLRRRRTLKAAYQAWQSERASGHSLPKNLVREEGPIARSGPIACGAVSSSAKYNKKLLAIDRKILAIDTESGGVFERAKRFNWNALTIRGISDYADANKSKLESSSAGKVRAYAARNASEFLKSVISNAVDFKSTLKGEIGSVTSNEENASTTPSLHEFVASLSDEIQSRLSDLSPEYKLLPKGYILPTPRIRPITFGANEAASEKTDPVEVVQGLARAKNIFVSVSQSYPEKSLAWVIADDLLRSEVDGKQVLPSVASGNMIKPPSGSIEAAIDLPTRPALLDEDVCDVVIIDGVPLTSRSRMKHLIEQLEKHKDTRFIFVDRTPSNIVFENEFIERLNCDLFELCDISFSQMAHFVQRNFDMTPSEADVIALRLRNTFRRFQLSAHPSYFAGIPQNTLASLIQANQRAELMELAVTGFLTFVVAEDRGTVQLSRTSRERFLKELVVKLRVEKHSFDYAELTKYIQEYAKQYGFEISPVDFLKGFEEHNVLNFHSGKVAFSLPFMEHYLLARALSEDPSLAKNYLDLAAPDFDIRTFDLYCEVGPDKELVASVVTELAQVVEEFTTADAKDEPLIWSADVDEAVGSGKSKAATLSKRIEEAAEAVRAGSDDRQEKQVLLDAADQVNERVTKRRSEIRGDSIEDDALDGLGRLAAYWSSAVVLLGSGAEHLDAEQKDALVASVLAGAETTIEELVQLHLNIDYESIKRDMSDDEVIDEIMSGAPEDFSRDDLIKALTSMIDGMKFINLSSTFHHVVGYLCEHARQAVLSLPVRTANGNSQLQEMLRHIWFADIDPSKAKSGLTNEIKKLPAAVLFRIAVSTHLIRRVYWTYSSKKDRLTMLDVAEETLKATNFSVGKGELVRLLERESKGSLEADEDSE